MRKIIIIACAVLLIVILALGATTAMGGFSLTGCGTLTGKPQFNPGDPVYEALCGESYPLDPLP